MRLRLQSNLKIVLYIRIAETLNNAVGIGKKLILGKIEGRNDLVEYALSYVLLHNRVVNAALNGVKLNKKEMLFIR